MVIERIPMWSCASCGESYFTARTMHEIERIKTLRKSVAKSRSVPVAQFEAAVSLTLSRDLQFSQVVLVFIVEELSCCCDAQQLEGLNEEQTATLETALLHAAPAVSRAGPDANRSVRLQSARVALDGVESRRLSDHPFIPADRLRRRSSPRPTAAQQAQARWFKVHPRQFAPGVPRSVLACLARWVPQATLSICAFRLTRPTP